MNVYHSIAGYIEATVVYNNTRGKIVGGKGFYFVNGKWVCDEEYFAANQKPVYEPPPKQNADGTCIPSSVMVQKDRSGK